MFSETKGKKIFERAMSAYLASVATKEEKEKVISLFEEAAKDPELTLPALLMKSELLNDIDARNELLEDLFERFPQSVGVWLSKAVSYFLSEENKEARKVFHKAKTLPLSCAWDALFLGRF
ncbi:MAG: hypothetical protein ACK4HQ_02715 [Brevinematales bacterium]